MQSKTYHLVMTTQGPAYPPSELMDEHGNFIVIGKLNINNNGLAIQEWGGAMVSVSSPLPTFGDNLPYSIIKRFSYEPLNKEDDCVLYTLPLPIPCNNYLMNFAPEQKPACLLRPSFPLHQVPIPDLKEEHGRKIDMQRLANEWFQAKQVESDFFYCNTVNELKRHQAQGDEVILVSGSFFECVYPIASYLGVKYCLCIHLECDNGAYTGRLLGEQTIGEGKKRAIEKYISQGKLSLK
jgi:HAD superfamily phosphoserine phosphatase-like hydrolase